MAKQTFTSGQVLTASQMNTLQTNDYNMTVTTGTASYTLQASDVGQRRVQNMGSAGTVTVPNSVFTAGDALWLHSIGSGVQTIAAGAGLTLNSTAGTAPTLAQWEGGVVYFTSASAAIFFRGGSPTLTVEYLVVAGGGASGGNRGGGGGAGGYRCSVSGENTGGGGSAESPLSLIKGRSYLVSVGAGGAAFTVAGSPSVFDQVLSVGGGLGSSAPAVGGNGGSGGGAGGQEGVASANGGTAATPTQGKNGGSSSGGSGGGTLNAAGGGGGGANAVGVNAANNVGGNGGAGLSSSITGSGVSRGGGGGGGVDGRVGGFVIGTGGTGGGGTAGATAGNGTVNTGGGGGGGVVSGTGISGVGGSGIVIIRYPDSNGTLASIGAGLTSTTGTYSSGGVTYRFYSFTAGTDLITLPS